MGDQRCKRSYRGGTGALAGGDGAKALLRARSWRHSGASGGCSAGAATGRNMGAAAGVVWGSPNGLRGSENDGF